MASAHPSAAASPRLFDLRLPPLTLLDGATVDPHHARLQWWGPETDLPVLERLATQVAPDPVGPVARTAPVRTGAGPGLDPSVPTVLVIHALTGDARAAGPDGWWAPLIGPGRSLDPAQVRILCANNLGSCYGSSGPLDAGWPAGVTRLTAWDQARALWSLLDVLGIERLRLTSGASLGGMIGLCLPVLRPGAVERLLPIGTSSASSAWVSGWNHVAPAGSPARPGMALGRGPGARAGSPAGDADLPRRAVAGRPPAPRRRPGARATVDAPHPELPRAPGQEAPPALRRAGLPAPARGDGHLRPRRAAAGHPGRAAPGVRPLRGHRHRPALHPRPGGCCWPTGSTARGAEARRATVRSPHGHDAFLIEWDALDPLVRLALGRTP